MMKPSLFVILNRLTFVILSASDESQCFVARDSSLDAQNDKNDTPTASFGKI